MNKYEKRIENFAVANRLQEIRKGTGLTQEKFAEKLGVSSTAYKKIESGENGVSLKVLKKYADVFNVSSDYILYGKSEDAEAIWAMIMNCTDEHKLRLLMRLTTYFSKVKGRAYCSREEQKKYDSEIENIRKEIDL